MEQNKENTSSVSRTLKEYFIITVAVLIMDIGIYVFKFPNNFSFGGVSGMAVIFCKISSLYCLCRSTWSSTWFFWWSVSLFLEETSD